MAVENEAMTIKGPMGGSRGGASPADDPAHGAFVREAPADASLRLYPPRTAKGLDPRHHAFTERIHDFRRAWLAQPGARPVGYLQILDLDQVRRHFGRRWDGLCDRVLQLVETTLESRLGPQDLYLVMSERLVWVLALGGERREIEVKGRLMASELTRLLCGALPGGIAVGFSTRLVNFEALADVDDPLGLLRRLAGLDPPPDPSTREDAPAA
ncbi:hypothetical protein [Marinimicrococcus flavescens]|uniref:GGDEF domain-containing protein n=1 Tax=Marinimicrococcus flavescens TaxID=3031815 RepID=A0AAP3XQQ0_9PROT|nr:hypothetical protein [Marinimicrococcus flavescens]